MSVGHRFAATAASRIYLTVVALVALPVYHRAMGQEAYGLVTLFLVLQVWLQMLDLGSAATLARETARHRANADVVPRIRQLARALELLFALTASIAGLALLGAAGVVAESWLMPERLPASVVVDSLRLMVLCILLRLLGDLYRGAISGSERLVWLSCSNTLFGTVRLVGVVPFLIWAGPDPRHFFGFQLACYLLEVIVLRAKAWGLMPPIGGIDDGRGLAPLRGVMTFSLSMTLASAVWSLASQVDKLVLSGLLSLEAFGAFGLAMSAAGGVLVLATALADALIPRLTMLHARGASLEFEALYRTATQWAGIVAWSAAGWLACHAERILWVWTGDADLARATAPVLSFYALGNGAMAVAAYPYYLQLAHGKLRMHLIGTTLMSATLLLGVIWVAPRHGASGAAAVWLLVNGLYLCVWTALAHSRFAPGLHRRWMFEDVVPVGLLALTAAAATMALPWPTNRSMTGLLLLPTALLILLVSAAGSGWVRSTLRQRFA